ncbi:uncharacterized protein LOC106669713 [Cimex lectularius]|uniref:Uncharacterized protein n=1 Tax=Cimex lectularius TaxID=79782 RepID=A0A8I6TJC1_CIMLE|nr:uncharacterized protein LOC106669713 [Cimex lectularius]
MEFDNICTVVQGLFKSLETKLNKKLAEIDPSLDHEDYIFEIIEGLTETIKEHELDGLQLKKVHMLLLLNSDFSNINLLDEDKNFCHVLNVLPKISKYLYFQLVTQMKWHNYLREVVLHFPEVIVYEIVHSINDYMNYISLDCALAFFYSLIDGMLNKILHIQNTCKYRTQKFVKLFVPLVQYNFNELIDGANWDRDKKYQYLGYTVRMYLDLVESCVKKLQNPEFSPDPFYEANVNYTYSKWGMTSSTTNWGYYCLRFVATKADEFVKLVSVDIYISWTEVEVKDAVGKTLQMSIRETAYTCQEAIRTIQHLYDVIPGLSSLDSCLATIAVRPVTEDEEIKEADANTIVINLLNPKRTQIKWLRGLIEKGIFESATYMKVIADNSSLIDYDTSLLLINKAFEYLETNSVDPNDLATIRQTIFISVKSLKRSDQTLLLARFCELYGNKSPLIGPDFHNRATQFFNRLVNDDSKKQEFYNEVICLAIESREMFIRRALDECWSSKAKTTLIMEYIEFVSPICLIISEETGLPLILTKVISLLDEMKNSPEAIHDNFVHLVKKLSEVKLINPSLFLYNHILPLIEKCHLEKDWNYLNYYLDLIEMILPIVRPSMVKFISIIAKTLNKLRPKVPNFKTENVEITEKCINILTSSVQNVLRAKTSEDEEIVQLRALGESLSALTWQYMIPIWKNWGKDLPIDTHGLLIWTKPGFGHGEALNDLNNEVRLHLVMSMVKILPQLTTREWERIGSGTKSLSVIIPTFKVLADCALVWFQVPFMLQNVLLLSHNITNFLNFTQKIVIPRLNVANEKDTAEVVDKMSQIMEQLPEELSKTKMPDLQRLKMEALGENKHPVHAN